MPEAVDRYPVDPLNGPAQFAEMLREIERRLSELEGAPPITTQNLRVAGSGGNYDAFIVDGDGMDTPQFPLPQNFVPGAIAPYVSIPSGGGWILISRCIMPAVISHAALRAIAGYSFDPGSSGQLRLRSRQTVSGADPVIATTTGPTLSGAGGSAEQIDWLHQLPLGEDTPYYVDLEGQVTSGPGNLLAYEPSITLLNGTHGATSPGVWAPL